MRTNRVKEIWREGGAVVNGWLSIGNSFAAEVMAHTGFDSLTIDLQHGVVDYTDAVGMLQAISTTDTVPLVRVPWNEPGIIMKLLDVGAYGVICPMVNSREEAEAFVGACRYPPGGYRSFGPKRATLYAGDDYAIHANETVLAIAMIETKQAVENLDAILSVPGLDGIYVGPADLSISYGGKERSDLTEPRLVAILDQIVEGCRRHGVAAGIHTGSPEYALQAIDRGFQFTTLQSEARFMEAEATRVLGVMGRGASPNGKGPY